jgi:hypothetical protein
MAVREVEHRWVVASDTAASTGGLDGIAVLGDVLEWAFYAQTDAGCTATVSIQTAATTSGPWVTEGSTNISTSGAAVFRGTGPLRAVRPYITAKTTGGITFTLIGNG